MCIARKIADNISDTHRQCNGEGNIYRRRLNVTIVTGHFCWDLYLMAKSQLKFSCMYMVGHAGSVI